MVSPEIYTNRQNGRLYVGVDEKFTGSIDRYNNFITKSVAYIFGWSHRVEINGKIHHLEKGSFHEWLKNNTIESSLPLSLHAVTISNPRNLGFMRDQILPEKRSRLFTKLVFAIEQGDFERAKKYVGKGAELNTQYWVRSDGSLSFTAVKSGLLETPLTLQAVYTNPLLQAARNSQVLFCQMLLRFGALDTVSGKEVTVTREIINTQAVSSTNPYFYSGRYRTHMGYNEHTTTTTHFKDSVQQTGIFHFNKGTNQFELSACVGFTPEVEYFSRSQTHVTGGAGVSVGHRPYHHHHHRHHCHRRGGIHVGVRL